MLRSFGATDVATISFELLRSRLMMQSGIRHCSSRAPISGILQQLPLPKSLPASKASSPPGISGLEEAISIPRAHTDGLMVLRLDKLFPISFGLAASPAVGETRTVLSWTLANSTTSHATANSTSWPNTAKTASMHVRFFFFIFIDFLVPRFPHSIC